MSALVQSVHIMMHTCERTNGWHDLGVARSACCITIQLASRSRPINDSASAVIYTDPVAKESNGSGNLPTASRSGRLHTQTYCIYAPYMKRSWPQFAPLCHAAKLLSLYKRLQSWHLATKNGASGIL